MASKLPPDTAPDPALSSPSTPEWLGLFGVALAVRLTFLFIAPNNGTDAWARYHIAQTWLRSPNELPSKVWLPLHFWLLAGILVLWNSEWSVRLLTLLFGAATILPFWGITRRAFGPEVARYSTLALALFGFHVGYSVTTSSEAPTIFFLACGVYFWSRLKWEDNWKWLAPAALVLIAASLCRFEAWIFIATLTLLLFDLSRVRRVSGLNLRALAKPASFGFFASAGAMSWMILSLVKWGDPLASPHATFAINRATGAVTAHSIAYELVVVPGALILTLSPVIAGLACWGIIQNLIRGKQLPKSLAVVVVMSLAANYYTCMASQVTMARYTLMYSWLVIPFAFDCLRFLSSKVSWLQTPRLYLGALSLFLLWQGGVITGASVARYPEIADHFSVISPTLPPPVEMRDLIRWLRRDTTPRDSVVVDQFQYEASDIIRFSGLSFSRCLGVPLPAARSQVEAKLRDFVRLHHPRLLVYCRVGELSRLWPLRGRAEADWPQFGVHLHRLWKGTRYEVYQLSPIHK